VAVTGRRRKVFLMTVSLLICVILVRAMSIRTQIDLYKKNTSGYTTDMFNGKLSSLDKTEEKEDAKEEEAKEDTKNIGEDTTKDSSKMIQQRAHTDIAGCLMVKEDNRIVPEWIAYHYHVLPMRDLIICEQPDSREFVEDTLHGTRWSPYSEDPLLNITYILAGETFYNKDSDKAYLVSDKYKEDGFPLHIQKACYEHCMKEFKERGKVRMRS